MDNHKVKKKSSFEFSRHKERGSRRSPIQYDESHLNQINDRIENRYDESIGCDRSKSSRYQRDSYDGRTNESHTRLSRHDRNSRRHRRRPSETEDREYDSYYRKGHDDSRTNEYDTKERPQRRRNGRSRSPASVPQRTREALPSQRAAFLHMAPENASDPSVVKQKPDFETSGKLAAETNTVTGTDIILKYNEPPEARKPPSSQGWRLYIFKGEETINQIELHSRSCWLFGREKTVVDYFLENPTCSKQHAAVQFRFVEKRNEFGDRIGKVKPYMIDLDSANGSKVNGQEVPGRRYVELMSGDVVTFGESTREYVFMLP